MELHTYLSMVTPLGKLTDLPTFKEKVRENPHNINYGLVGYPVLMAADILLYKADFVPVGVDQAPHIEFTRECVRSFNYRYNSNVLIEPQMKVTEFPKIIGIDGTQKMGKSLDNHIEMASTPEDTTKTGHDDDDGSYNDKEDLTQATRMSAMFSLFTKFSHQKKKLIR